MKMEDNVPITTPKIIAKAKLRILSPPSTKIHNNTINVLNEVLMVTFPCQVLNKEMLSKFPLWDILPKRLNLKENL